MRGLLLLGGLAIVFAGAGAGAKPVKAQDDKAYDLRGPAPEKGQVFQNKMTLVIKDADTVLMVMGIKLEGKMTMDMSGEEEQKVLAVNGRNVTKCQSKIIKEQAKVTTDLGGMQTTQTMPTELEGTVIISERDGDKWKHKLVDDQPSEKQKKELDNRNGIENDDDLYPAEKVKVGHEWQVEAKALTKLFGNSFTDIKGQLKQKFVKIEKVDGEDCAVIESSGRVKGKMKDDDNKPTLDMEMDLKTTTWRSLKSGLDLKGKFGGKMKMSGKQKIDDQSVDITMSGPMSGETTSKLK